VKYTDTHFFFFHRWVSHSGVIGVLDECDGLQRVHAIADAPESFDPLASPNSVFSSEKCDFSFFLFLNITFIVKGKHSLNLIILLMKILALF